MWVASSPGSLANCKGRSVKIESLVHIVGACANYLILENISEVSVMGVYKITKIFKKCCYLVWLLEHRDSILGQSSAKLVAI